MTTPQFDEPGGEATGRVAQMAAMGVTVLEAIARLRAQRAAEQVDADQRAATAARQQRLADHATARLAWSPALDNDWLRRASAQDLGRAWAAAMPWSSTDTEAAHAAARAEARLAVLHPEAMTAYQQARADGATPGEAMSQAAPLFARHPPLAAEAERPDPARTGAQREPRVIADDAYPYPTSQAVAAAARTRGGVHVVTTAPAHPHTTRAVAAR
jgi:hypothetical protein